MKALLKENGFDLTEVNSEKTSVDLDQSCHSKIRRKRRRFDIKFQTICSCHSKKLTENYLLKMSDTLS